MRQINELIWHCTATPEGREVSAAEIRRWHVSERGWSDIGYHKVVHLDGSVSEGRPESQVGAHVANRNAHTIGYVYVGGVDANDRKRAKDTRTKAQKATMERLTREAIARYGLRKVSGHSDYANKACPCFNARATYAHLIPNRLGIADMPEIDDERDSKYDEPIIDEGRPGFFRRVRNWIGGAAGGTGLGFLAYLTDWQIALVFAGVFLVIVGITLFLIFWLFDAPELREWIKRKVG